MSKPTHDDLAMQWRKIYPQTLYGAGEWRRYKNGHWPAVAEADIKREVLGVLQANKENGISPTDGVVSSVTSLAQIMVSEDERQWDAEADYVVLLNGTLKLSTMELLSHDPSLKITGALDFEYNNEADCPNWRKSLERLPSDVVNFLQEFSGYAITTDTRHELALWLYGLPGGGKSTFLEGLRSMLGGRVCNLNLGMIERSSFGLTSILGKTLAVSAEQPADYVRSTHVINSIISGESITIDRKFKDPLEVISRVKICWAMNEFPRIPDAGNGIFRRVKVVTFKPIPRAEMDLDLKTKVRAEASGIFNWALSGLARLNERKRFDVPMSVEIDTRSFQKNNDVVSLFIDDKCELIPTAESKSSELYGAYSAWCHANGHKPKSSTACSEEFKRLGFEKVKKSSGMYWIGVKVKGEFI